MVGGPTLASICIPHGARKDDLKSLYITTAIDYANAKPHLGHAYEKVLTDTLARFARRQGVRVRFLSGLDEHGQKVQQSAAKTGQSPQHFVDGISAEFLRLWDILKVEPDDYLRTTQTRHRQVVQSALNQLHAQGDIVRGTFKGFYSIRAEQFLTEKERQADGSWPVIYGEVVELTEENYFFKLSKHQDWLRELLTRNPNLIFPDFRAKEVLGALEKPLPDLCISRPKTRLAWGIPLPFDENQVTYVWFDALLNYVTGAGSGQGKMEDWQPAVHVIGKDILVPAHGIYWPCMLRALGLPVFEQLLVHGFWTRKSEKLSKSTGNVVDPELLAAHYGADSFRYYVLREMALGHDADFDEESLAARRKGELAHELGNLLQRAGSMVGRYRDGKIPTVTKPDAVSAAFRATVLSSLRKWDELMTARQIHLALGELWKGVQAANQMIESRAPWKLAKDPAQADALDATLGDAMAALELVLEEVACVIPSTASAGLRQIGHRGDILPRSRDWPQWPVHQAGRALGKIEPLFPLLEEDQKKTQYP
ncbi:MAG: methionine--tRNA ligase [Verrucomicrobia bacterium]|nr:methionine--tRNA ligase [Verrucomicrobiota bacterium]